LATIFKPALEKNIQDMYRLNHFPLIVILSLSLGACDVQHFGEDVKEHSGDYRFYAGIGEFFDCDDQVKYIVAKSGIHSRLADKYAALGVAEKEDVYTKVEGYLKQEARMEGLDPMTVFVPTKFISFDESRGCNMMKKKKGR
jgi:hypothetical protein